MAWIIRYDHRVLKELRKLDKAVQLKILHYLEESVALLEDPRSFGKRYISQSLHTWRYRVGDYRIICEIQELTIFVLKIGHRKDIYDA